MVGEKVFGAAGLLSRAFGNYEPRDGQGRMADLVEGTIASGGSCIAEAACGIGKSFAYLFPAMMSGAGRVVVVTSNIALQEQVAFKDAPFVRDALVGEGLLRRDYMIGHLKGKNNYLCVTKMQALSEQLIITVGDRYADEQVEKVMEWFGSGECSGDASDLPFVPVSYVRAKCFGDSEGCLGSDCFYRDQCFYEEAKARAVGSDLIVLNYHMLFSDFRVKEASGGFGILPSYDVLICDEGHEMADVARGFLGDSIGYFGIKLIATALMKFGFSKEADNLFFTAEQFFDEVVQYKDGGEYKNILREPEFVNDKDLFWALDAAADALTGYRGKTPEEDTTKKMYAKRAGDTRDAIRAIVKMDDPEYVYWIEATERTVRLNRQPVDVAPFLRGTVFKKGLATIVTSATLCAGLDFSFIRGEIGMDGGAELIEQTPFDMEAQALLVCPEMRCDPNDEGFVDEISDIIADAVKQAGGRTLALFTSYKNMNGVYDRIYGEWHYLLKQGDKSRKMLLNEFKDNVEATLLATSSFWTGVDVQGESLSCLIMDKLPFPNQGDPLLVWLEEHGTNVFRKYSLPKAVLAFKQGCGRLVRHTEDRGVILVLDKRLLEKPYGRTFLNSLPKMNATRNHKRIAGFLNGGKAHEERKEVPEGAAGDFEGLG